jgi:integrase
MPRPPKLLTHLGLTLSLEEWSKRTGVSAETIRCRINHLGWDVATALTTPADRRFRGGGARPKTAPRPCPRLLHHRASDQAYVAWRAAGKQHTRYFGPYGSAAAAEGYARFCLEWAAGAARPKPTAGVPVLIAELTHAYLTERVDRYYIKNGRWTSERGRQYAACKILNQLYGTTRANDFDPAKLRAVIEYMVRLGWTRSTINANHWRFLQCWEWGVGQSMVEPDVHQRLKAVETLRAGRSAAPDRPKKKPVPTADLNASLAVIHPDPARAKVLRDMIAVHLLTGMRPGELCAMRPADLEDMGGVLLYRVRPEVNKNTHLDKPLQYWIGPRAMGILAPYLAVADRSEPIWRFPPRGRGTVRTPIQRLAYGEFVRMACDRAGVTRWHPHQLRHNRATAVQREFEDNRMAAAAIGDTPEVAAAVYVDPLDAARRRIALAMG